MHEAMPGVDVRKALVVGGTGQIGRAVLGRLRQAGWDVVALSRDPQPDEPGLTWLRGGLGESEPLPQRVEAVVSCGPLDAFARWHAQSPIEAARIVAFSSTSVRVKQNSPDEAERDVAQRLQHAEDVLMATSSARGAPATLLRPTLVYGAARDATLSRIAQLAHRVRVVPLPRRATGLRQPVHVDDLADAALACLAHPATAGRGYDLPGGEALPYREMVRRVLQALEPPARLLELPAPLFDLVVRMAQARGMAAGFGDAALDRMRRDLVFDDAPARADFGYAPRPFRPTARMFPPRG
ncbi:NAD(P)-dependent oxidoreductase [Lysobacter sp. N42]|uniref:NAD-dependent epimerase/dehydratase family protein n=1 Tax=Lysobacter sp. N42 TaxID=2545719 RepID=UPI001047399D|nr:NAD-dependent epimerase/dehydratase family protein [Lysobacter sp. N42]TCZ84012.1 NAD-dependent epimerase/dehydratase family protein [Lysobacter sp. N42]